MRNPRQTQQVMKYLFPTLAYVLFYAGFLGVCFSSFSVVIQSALFYWLLLIITLLFLILSISEKQLSFFRGVPTAIVAASLSVYLTGFLLHVKGIRIPDHISVLGFATLIVQPTHVFLFSALIPLSIRLFIQSMHRQVRTDFTSIIIYIALDLIYHEVTPRGSGNAGPIYFLENYLLQGRLF